jgi:hypothetical protein
MARVGRGRGRERRGGEELSWGEAMAVSRDARTAFTIGLSTHEEAELSAPCSYPSTKTPVLPCIRQNGRRVQLAARRVVAARRRERKEDEE